MPLNLKKKLRDKCLFGKCRCKCCITDCEGACDPNCIKETIMRECKACTFSPIPLSENPYDAILAKKMEDLLMEREIEDYKKEMERERTRYASSFRREN